jgi:hypothetical protein
LNIYNFAPKNKDDKVLSGEPYYDLVHGGSIDPFELLKCTETAQAVRDAADLLESFFENFVEEY